MSNNSNSARNKGSIASGSPLRKLTKVVKGEKAEYTGSGEKNPPPAAIEPPTASVIEALELLNHRIASNSEHTKRKAAPNRPISWNLAVSDGLSALTAANAKAKVYLRFD